jgi:alpha-mannosidase
MAQTMHVISHTHWDREWYRPFQVFRTRLVDVVDAVLDLLESHADYRYFHLDGQTIVLEDYLEIRPEREAQLRKFIAGGRLLVGPWYTQPDEFLVSGEAMVRNLMLGRKMAQDFGACMDLGYLPDSFGHASQMPQIFAGFGFHAAILFRGITADQVKSTFVWRSADGTRLLTAKLPDDDAYSNFLYRLRATLSDPQPIEPERLRRELARLRSDCDAMAVCDQQLWMDGVDHIFPNPKTPEIIMLANQQFADANVIHSTLPDYITALQKAAPALGEVQGELRHANRAWTLQAVLANVASSHIAQKQANFGLQQMLERMLEPLCTLNWLAGGEYPRTYLDLAWKHLLQNHAHDSICGCSVDQVHRDMNYRFDQVRLIADIVRDRTIQEMAKNVDTTFITNDETGVLVYNPSPWTRYGTHQFDVTLPADATGNLSVKNSNGEVITHQVLDMHDSAPLRQPKYDIPTPQPKRIVRLAVNAKLAAYAFNAFTVKSANIPQRAVGTLFTASHVMENKWLKVSVEADGTLTLNDKRTGKRYDGLLAIEDRGDGGEGWNWIPPMRDRIYLSPGSSTEISRVLDGPLLCALNVKLHFMVPEGFTGMGHEHDPLRMVRSDRMVEMPVEFTVSLGAESQRLDIEVNLTNSGRNHRVRVLFPTDLATNDCYADSAFDVVKRPINQGDSHDWHEPQLGTYPMQSFVCAQDEVGGLAIFTTGTPEYEVMDEPRRTIAITLLRAFGRGAGEPHEYVDSQELGEHRYHLSLMPYQDTWESAQVMRESREFALPVIATTVKAQSGEKPVSHPALIIEATDIDVTAVKHCDTRESVIVRMVNLSDATRGCLIKLANGIAEAYLTNMAEERSAPSEITANGALKINISARQIVTLELVPRA